MQALKSYKGLLQSYKGPHPPSYPQTHLNNLESRLTVPPSVSVLLLEITLSPYGAYPPQTLYSLQRVVMQYGNLSSK